MKVKIKTQLDGALYRVISWEMVDDAYSVAGDETLMDISDVPDEFYMSYDEYHYDDPDLVHDSGFATGDNIKRAINPATWDDDYDPALIRANTYTMFENI